MIRKQNIKTGNLMESATTAVRKGIQVDTVRHRRTAIIKDSRKLKRLLIEMNMIWYYADK